MSSKNKSKRKTKCPGCGTPKDLHDFAVMGKHCEGPEEPDPDSDGIVDDMSSVEKEKTIAPRPGDKQETLLQAIRALSSQVEALQLEQHTPYATLSTSYKLPKLLLGALPQHTNRPLLPTATTTTPFSKNAIFHLAQTVVLAI